jgi:hypothetical protein
VAAPGIARAWCALLQVMVPYLLCRGKDELLGWVKAGPPAREAPTSWGVLDAYGVSQQKGAPLVRAPFLLTCTRSVEYL